MSHFTVLVVGPQEEVETQLIPFQEHACTGKCPEEYLEFHDREEEMRKDYESGTRPEFFDASSCSHGMVVYDSFYTQLEGKKVGDRVRVDFTKQDLDGIAAYFKKGSCYHIGRYNKNNYPKEQVWVKVLATMPPNPNNIDTAFEGTILLEIINAPKEIPLTEYYPDFETYAKDYEGYSKRDEKTGRYGYWENPNKKWDWWEVGGRWAGKLRIKPEFHHLYQEETPNFSWGWDADAKREVLTEVRVDSAKKGHVDWEAMMETAAENAAKKYDYVMEHVIKDTPVNESWESFLGEDEDTRDIGELKEKYWGQPRCKAWKEFEKKVWEDKQAGKDVKEAEKYVHGFYDSPDDYLLSREQFIQDAKRQAIHTFAFLKDGKWAEKGEMGFWAIVHNEKDSWPEIFYKLLQDVSDEEYVTVVDCHI